MAVTIGITRLVSSARQWSISLLWFIPIFGLVPGLYLAARGATNEFLYQNLALVSYSLDKPHIAEGLSHSGFNFAAMQEKFPAYQSMLLAISQATGLSPYQVQYLPLGSILIGVILYVLVRSVLPARVPAMLLTLSMLFDVSFMVSEYSVFVYAWTYSLFLLYVILMVNLTKEGRSPATLAFIILTFVAAYFYHYTMPVWMIVFGFGLLAISQWARVRVSAGLSDSARGAQGIVLACLVFYMSFNQLLYDVFIRQLSRDDAITESTTTLADRLFSLLGNAGVPQLPYTYIEPASVYGLLRLSSLGLLPVTVFAGLLVAAWRILSGERNARVNWLIVLGVPSIAVLVVDMATYAGFGVVSTKFLVLMFPLLAVLAVAEIWRGRQMWAQGMLAGLFLVLNVLSFVSFANNPKLAPESTYTQVEPSAKWLFSEAGDQPRVLSDLHTLGRYLLAGSSEGKFIQPCYWSPDVYDSLTGKQSSAKAIPNCDYIAIDVASAEQPLAAPSWKWYEPVGPHLQQIAANAGLSEVYKDATVVIYRIKRES
jgi:hypothetical protein